MAKEEMNRSDGERRKVKKVKRNGRRKAGGRKDDKMNRKRPGGDGVELGKLATEPPCKEPKVGQNLEMKGKQKSEKNVSCPWISENGDHCPEMFTLRGHLKDHIYTHENRYPYICSECGVADRTRSNVRSHGKSKHQWDEERSKCAVLEDMGNFEKRVKNFDRLVENGAFIGSNVSAELAKDAELADEKDGKTQTIWKFFPRHSRITRPRITTPGFVVKSRQAPAVSSGDDGFSKGNNLESSDKFSEIKKMHGITRSPKLVLRDILENEEEFVKIHEELFLAGEALELEKTYREHQNESYDLLECTQSEVSNAIERSDKVSAELQRVRRERADAVQQLDIALLAQKKAEDEVEHLKVKLSDAERRKNELSDVFARLEQQGATTATNSDIVTSAASENNAIQKRKSELDRLKKRLYDAKSNRKNLSKDVERKDECLATLERQIAENDNQDRHFLSKDAPIPSNMKGEKRSGEKNHRKKHKNRRSYSHSSWEARSNGERKH